MLYTQLVALLTAPNRYYQHFAKQCINLAEKGGKFKVFVGGALGGSLKPQNCLLNLLPTIVTEAFSILFFIY